MKFRIKKIINKKNTPLVILIVISLALLLLARLLAEPTITREQAAGTARLFFTPSTTQTSPLQKNSNDTFTLDLKIDPSTSNISFVKFEILYDPAKLSIDGASGVQINTSAFPVVFEGPVVSTGKAAASISVGSDPTKAITTTSSIARITFTALADSNGPIQVAFSNNSQALSVGPDAGATDNVLGSMEPAFIQIGSFNGTIYPTSTIDPSSNPTSTPPITNELIGCTIELDTSQNVFDIHPVNSNLWITTTNGVVTINTNGQQLKPEIVGNGLESPSGIAKVDNEIWILNRYNKKINRFNTNGGISNPAINLTGSTIPENVRLTGITYTGSEVWIADEDNGLIYRLDKNGRLIATISHPSLDAPAVLTKIGNEIWAMNSNFHIRINEIPEIVRFTLAGNYINDIKSTGRLFDEVPIDLQVVGSDIWYVSAKGNDTKIIPLNSNGTVKGVSLTIKEMIPRRFTVLNDYIYFLIHTQNGNDIRIFNIDRSAYICQPELTLTPTPTGISGTQTPPRTTLDLKLLFNGLGSAGDSKSLSNNLSNKNPIHQERTLNIQIVNEENKIVATKLAPAFYNSSTGQFDSHVLIYDPLPEGEYIVKVKAEPYLRKLMPGFLKIEPGVKNTMEVTNLVTGDVNGDNALNILDYNVLYDCGYGALNPLPMINKQSNFNTRSCIKHVDRDNTDLNDNGVVDSSDYNLFIRELSVGFGQ